MEIGGIGSGVPNNNSINTTRNKVSDESFEKRLQKAMDEKDEQELKKACQDFEGILLGMMYKQMKASIPKSELIPSDAGREMFESMLDDALVEEASKGNGYGLGDALYRQLSARLKSTYKISDKGE